MPGLQTNLSEAAHKRIAQLEQNCFENLKKCHYQMSQASGVNQLLFLRRKQSFLTDEDMKRFKKHSSVMLFAYFGDETI